MRKVPQEEVAAAARRRLELLVRELDQSGVTRLDRGASDLPAAAAPDPTGPASPGEPGPALVAPSPVAPAGRHAASRQAGTAARSGGALRALLPDTLRGRVSLDRGVFVVVAVLAVLAVGAAAVAVGRESGPSTPAVPAAETAAATSASPLVTPGGPTAAPSSPTGGSTGGPAPPTGPAGGTVVVHVSGDVRRPGVVELATGARVADAVREAGGARRGVSLDGVNLARVLVDGEQVQVGGAAPAASGPAAAAVGTAAPATGALVSLNAATLDQLDTLPGVGPVTAQKILDWRTAHGAFSAVDELLEVDGIGEKTLAEIAPHVTL
ncbi:helix-hairpin-helix domain-containing protein [Nocardioides aequoreus]|uniref:helix-hairpin-helix domain-containing protein n=1 Tax=Nocardioides aequoreus TaxID=397278 RepID=UPI00068A63F3|nr:helix-hairpin-helix domain-containing protein [Nocardioides aequoreus]